MSQSQCFACQKKVDASSILCPYCAGPPIHQTIDEAVMEMVTLVEKLNVKVADLRTYFTTLGLPPSDKRNQTLAVLNFLFLRLSHQLISYHELTTNPNNASRKEILEKNSHVPQQSLDTMVVGFDILNQRDFLVGFLFIIEDFLESVNKILKNQTSNNGYKNLVKHVVNELFGMNADSELFRELYFPAIVRNSLHKGGIHTENDYNGKIDGVFFKFENGKPVHGGWRNIYFFCDKVLDAINQILKNKQIENIPIPSTSI